MGSFYWSEDQIAALRVFMRSGKTYREIAQIFNTTKNVIIGKANRLKIHYPASIRNRTVAPKKYRTRKFRKQKDRLVTFPHHNDISECFLKDRSEEPQSLNRTVLTLEDNECRYPHGDSKKDGILFCGHETLPFSSYCAFHHRCCYNGAKPIYKSDEEREEILELAEVSP